jgi:TolA-binding protein
VHPQLAVALYRLGQVQAELGDLASAAAALGRAVEVDTAAYGPDHPKVATDLHALAAVQEQQGKAEAAAATRAQAQRIRDLHQSPPIRCGVSQQPIHRRVKTIAGR